MKLTGLRRLPDTDYVLGIARIAVKDTITSEMKLFVTEELDTRKNIDEWFKKISLETDGVIIDEDVIWLNEFEKQQIIKTLNDGDYY